LCEICFANLEHGRAEAANWLSDPDRYGDKRWSLARREYGHTIDPNRKKFEDENFHDFHDLQPGTPWDRAKLAHVLGVNGDGLLPVECKRRATINILCVKKLRDFLRVDVDQWETDADVRSPLGNFVSKLLAEGKIHVTHNTN
jgi:hypothetical protein